MPEIDEFARLLLEQSKRYAEKASNVEGDARAAYLHAAALMAFCSLEAHVNSIIDDFQSRQELSIHERAFLIEKAVHFDRGRFVLGNLKITRLEDRIRFLHCKFGGGINTESDHWSQLSHAMELRNQLTHPKHVVAVTVRAVEQAIQAVVGTLDALYRALYRRPFPAAARGLQSTLDF